MSNEGGFGIGAASPKTSDVSNTECTKFYEHPKISESMERANETPRCRFLS